MTISNHSSPRLEPITSNKEKTYTHIGRGGGGNIFQTEETKRAPRLIPVSSAGHNVPPDQKKFSISRGGYGNIKDNNPKNASPTLAPENEEEIAQNLTPLESVRSIGRGGFGNQIKRIPSKDSTPNGNPKAGTKGAAQNGQHRSFMGKIKKMFK